MTTISLKSGIFLASIYLVSNHPGNKVRNKSQKPLKILFWYCAKEFLSSSNVAVVFVLYIETLFGKIYL